MRLDIVCLLSNAVVLVIILLLCLASEISEEKQRKVYEEYMNLKNRQEKLSEHE